MGCFENAGFSTATPWLKAGKTYAAINVATENRTDFLLLPELIRLRKELPIIAEGDYKGRYQDSDKVYAFERQLDGQ